MFLFYCCEAFLDIVLHKGTLQKSTVCSCRLYDNNTICTCITSLANLLLLSLKHMPLKPNVSKSYHHDSIDTVFQVVNHFYNSAKHAQKECQEKSGGIGGLKKQFSPLLVAKVNA